jgi:hypothetical protein
MLLLMVPKQERVLFLFILQVNFLFVLSFILSFFPNFAHPSLKFFLDLKNIFNLVMAFLIVKMEFINSHEMYIHIYVYAFSISSRDWQVYFYILLTTCYPSPYVLSTIGWVSNLVC